MGQWLHPRCGVLWPSPGVRELPVWGTGGSVFSSTGKRRQERLENTGRLCFPKIAVEEQGVTAEEGRAGRMCIGKNVEDKNGGIACHDS